ncbi:hypothetical protein HYV86_04380 [Candidatus Woesearchaeota archaeon]|nr:hypothetical protein [Candidatus Woesearchaeota archaeon]
MVTTRQWVVLNVSLGLIGLILLLYLLGTPFALIGRAQYTLASGEPSCLVEWEGESTALGDLDRCCLAAATQLSCEKDAGEYHCTSADYGVAYTLNSKAYYYCKTQPYWRH